MTVLEALTHALGKEVQEVGGRSCTHVTANFLPSDTTLKVHTTLGFPDAGVIWLQGKEFAYTSRTDKTFVGIDAWRPLAIARGAPVVSATRRIRPDTYALFWPTSPSAAAFYGTSPQDYLRSL